MMPFFPVVLLFVASCTSAPATPAPADAPALTASAPEWTSRSLSLEGDQLVFVLSGKETAPLPDLALPAMTAYLDLPLGPKTPAIAARAVEEYLAATSRTAPADRYSKNGKSWWKIVLSKEAWDQSRANLKALMEAAVDDPTVELELSAQALLQQGRYHEAVTGYVTAAAAAVAEGRPARPERFRILLGKAQSILSSFTLSSTTPLQTTEVGQAFSTTFDVKVTFGPSAQSPGVAGAELRFSFPVKKNGRLAVTGQSVRADAEGQVQFALPVPDFSSNDSLVVLFDVNPWVQALVAVPSELKDSVTRFETIAAERKLLLPFRVESASKKVPMIVALADFDERGTVLRRQESTTAVIAALQKAGFQTSSVPVNPTLLKSPNENVILAAWKFQGKTSGRAVYGTVNLVSTTSSGSEFSTEVTGTLKVVDLATSKAVYQGKSSKIALAADKASSITLAFRQWAAEAVATLELELP